MKSHSLYVRSRIMSIYILFSIYNVIYVVFNDLLRIQFAHFD